MNSKLWQKENEATLGWVEEFTIGSDPSFDLLLAKFDIQASVAHAEMLAEAGLISNQEGLLLKQQLEKILEKVKDGTFAIETGVEDIHSQVELMLTRELGDVGRKIHTARSRNDQVLVDIKLFIKSELIRIAVKIRILFDLLQELSEKHKEILLPGYTHFQPAMPSSFGLWFGAYSESLSEDLEIWGMAFGIANKNPLGSGAGYGSSLPIDRTITTHKLNFATLNYNSVYAQMTRGKTEKIAAVALAAVASTLGKMCVDLCLFLSPNFNFISFPEGQSTGSSIMPHKKNPDVFELVRGRCNLISGLPNQITLLTANLPSGYHRDFQLSKECLFPGFKSLGQSLDAMASSLAKIEVRHDILNDPLYNNIFSVEEVNRLVMTGIPFREAYGRVAGQIKQGSFKFEGTLRHGHQGSIGNLENQKIKEVFYKTFGLFQDSGI